MRRSLVALPLLLAWVAMCLPWQICASDCRTAVVGGWKHDCHLPDAHAGCAHHGHHTDSDRSDDPCLCPGDHGAGSHVKFWIPLAEPGPSPQVDDQPAPPGFPATGLAQLQGVPRKIVARCTGPPGSPTPFPAHLRSVVLLL